ncbi:high mobility group box domain-containing protein [Zychaea mexicana]|uniref:high mobility group box domain-containing protein n=1 Tax=Zychaea mexicana TaxID=64656 RepID=UPI0022FE9F3D|nr:high mobility group box domain-containing protein [Zychaea mexicana]KAI9492474.1 high mobility group box domain-containing protein [Zychaea mexicana]
MTDQSNRSNLGGSSRLEHLVSPDAIREAEREEKEEGMGINAEHHPFSAYPSILSMKKHERRHSGSNSASPPLPPTLSPEQYSDDSPSPSSSATISSSSMGDKEDALVGSLEETSISGHSHGHYGPGCGISDKIDTAKDKRHQQPPIKERLKRPPNAYLLFNRDMRRRLLEESPKMTVAEISKEIGERWKRLDAERRQNYMQQAALIKQDHLKTHPDFIYTRRSKAQLAEARKFSRSRKGSHRNSSYYYYFY